MAQKREWTVGGELLITTRPWTLLHIAAPRSHSARAVRSARRLLEEAHSSQPFQPRRLAALSIADLELVQIEHTLTRWALFARWRKTYPSRDAR